MDVRAMILGKDMNNADHTSQVLGLFSNHYNTNAPLLMNGMEYSSNVYTGLNESNVPLQCTECGYIIIPPLQPFNHTESQANENSLNCPNCTFIIKRKSNQNTQIPPYLNMQRDNNAETQTISEEYSRTDDSDINTKGDLRSKSPNVRYQETEMHILEPEVAIKIESNAPNTDERVENLHQSGKIISNEENGENSSSSESSYKIKVNNSKVAKSFSVHKKTKARKKPLECDICGLIFKHSHMLRTHMETHTLPYICNECGFISAFKNEFKIHVIGHKGGKVHECKRCNYVTSSSVNLKAHNDSQSHRKKSFKCCLCEFTSHKYGQFIKHLQAHSGKEPYICGVCNSSSKSSRGLFMHLRGHALGTLFRCQMCEYTATHSAKLEAHMRSHSDARPFICEVCGMTFKQPVSLRAHKEKHIVDKPYKCDICGHREISSERLVIHMQSHLEDKPYKCDWCDYSSVQAKLLKRHVKIHTGEQRKMCSLCGHVSASPCALKLHMRTHTGEKPYKCPICDFATAYKNCMTCHMRKHTGEKPYKCDTCGRCLASSGELKRHIRLHTGEKPYKCHLCDYAAAQPNGLRVHKKKHASS